MLDRVRGIPGHRLGAAAYLDEFWPYFDRLGGRTLWKLERAQSFREPDVPSWVAMAQGDWERALTLVEEMRPAVTSNEGPDLRRLRIVDKPITPYLQWEMQILRIRVEAGEKIRVLPVDSIAYLESTAELPEVVILGSLTMYEVLYDDTGILIGARRVDDQAVLDACRAQLAELYDKGEALLSYFDREIATLPPPTVTT
ncbi:hypothetical protein GCM10022226_29370 [Sphaerisporangium flaviroseum]|uniref:DUF6879 domain-containing protein n=1 Tax=Sphaerisporangium flaviroseum TaxID=509199 RepID=A0ABP7HYA5_9ACTN